MYLLLIGLPLLIIGLLLLLRRRAVLENGVHTEAEVVNIVRNRGSRNATSSPVIRYMADGVEREVVYRVGDSKPKYQVGEVIKVAYNKNNPEDVHILDDKMHVFALLVFILLGLVFVLIGVFSS